MSRGVVWSVLQNPSLELHTGKTSDGSGPGTFQSSITGLASNTSYFVRAYASNSAGVAYGNELQFVTGSLPQADFIAAPASGTAPLMVSFTDQSTSNPTQWQWSFGDGNTRALQNPAHTCENAGSYSVQLTVSNGYGSDTETKNDYIIVNDFICGSSTLRWLCLYPAIFLLFIAAPGTTCVHN